MHNWDARDELGAAYCTLDADWESVQKTCEILKIEKLSRVNFQSSYWQRVFDPIIQGYSTSIETPNPDILCNREIKFGDLFRWAFEELKVDALATGHYARILNNHLRQSADISKDQTYFLAAVNQACWSQTIFPVGDVLKAQVKGSVVREAKLDHLIGRKESMGMCFVGKRDKFKTFLDQFISSCKNEPGPIVHFDSNRPLLEQHKGLSFYTLGQSARVGGVGKKLYVARKCSQDNTLYVVDRQDHPLLLSKLISIRFNQNLVNSLRKNSRFAIFCSVRSNEKFGSQVADIEESTEGIDVHLKHPVYAPCSGQWAVFYAEDELSKGHGRLCLGGSQIK